MEYKEANTLQKKNKVSINYILCSTLLKTTKMKELEIKNEPNFVTDKIAWVKWNMKTYNNTLTDALKLLKQKEMLASF